MSQPAVPQPLAPPPAAPVMSTVQLVEVAYKTISQTFEYGVRPDTVMSLVMTTIATVEHIRGASGAQKKEVAIEVIERFVGDIDDDDTRAAVKSAVRVLGPHIIDGLVSAANGKLRLANGDRRGCLSTLPCFR